ncbi:MAG: Efflux pump periplasmic linker BepF [Bacteroidota bacterium]|nr:efflux RND transporter periplasmic adaptor subunit [uncultured Flavobacterium sp.]
MTRKSIIITLFIITLGSLITYRVVKNSAQNDKGGKSDKKPPMKVTGMLIKPENFTNTLALSGSIEANEQINLHSEVSGIVTTIGFKEGSIVQKGQLLVKIDDTELRAQLRQAKTKENLASENARRAKLLLEKEAISQEEYDIATADYRSMKAQTQVIQAQVAKTSIKAPFTGKIGLRTISPGTYITPTTEIASLVNSNIVKIAFSIPEKYANDLKLNTEISCSVPNSSETFTAKIYAIEPSIETNTRTLKIKAQATNSNGKLVPGTFAKVTLPIKNIENAIRIPSECVVAVQEGKKVFIANHGKAKEIHIETLTRTEKDVIVTSGLKAGDTLITTGIMSLKNEAEIKVKVK